MDAHDLGDEDDSDSLGYAITAGNTGTAFAIDGNGAITVADMITVTIPEGAPRKKQIPSSSTNSQ